MADNVALALEAIAQVQRSRGYRELDRASRSSLERNLGRVAKSLGADPYSHGLDAPLTPLQERQQSGTQYGYDGASSSTAKAQPAPPQPAPAPPPPPPTSIIGQRTADTLDAVNFPGFVAALITGTFKAIVDASIQQIKSYSELIASITQSLEDFSGQNVSDNQTRDELAKKYPLDLFVQLPPPGTDGAPKLLPKPERVGESPDWLGRYGLEGQELSEELTNGPLLEKGRVHVGEDRLQTLATLVLMGINRIVVNEGDIRAKLQFHAAARELTKAELDQDGAQFAARNVDTNGATQMMVSTVRANAQAEASIKADLVGEVRVSFRSETFPLERFADSAAIQLLSRHAKWKGEPQTAAPAPSVTAPASSSAAATPAAGSAAPAAPTGAKP